MIEAQCIKSNYPERVRLGRIRKGIAAEAKAQDKGS